MRRKTLGLFSFALAALVCGAFLAALITKAGNEVQESIPSAIAEQPDALSRGIGTLTLQELRSFHLFPVFWVGEDYQGYQLTEIFYSRDSGPPDGRRPPSESIYLTYGGCELGDVKPEEGSCVPSLVIISERFCLNQPSFLVETARRGPRLNLRGALGQQNESHHLHLYTGESTIIVFSAEGDEAALEAANNLEGANGLGKAAVASGNDSLEPPMKEEDCQGFVLPTPSPTETPMSTATSTPLGTVEATITSGDSQ